MKCTVHMAGASLPPSLYAVLLAAGALLFLAADHGLQGWMRVAGMGAGAALCLLMPLVLVAIAPARSPTPRSTAGLPSGHRRW